jgi:hypothetical protein
MGRMRWILSNLSVINITLAAVLIVFAGYAFLPLSGKSAKLAMPAAKRQASAAATSEKPAEIKSPSPSDYFIIAEQNIFHPERKIPVEKKEAAAPPLPKPDFVLYGTLILDDMKIAYMEDRKAPQNSPTRGKKQIPLRPGQALSGFVLKEIDADKVVMVRGDEKLEVQLNDASKSKTREGATTATGTQAGAPPQAAVTSPFSSAQPPTTGAATAPQAAKPGIFRRGIRQQPSGG